MKETRLIKLPITGKLRTKYPPNGFKESPLAPIPLIEYYSTTMQKQGEFEKTVYQYSVWDYDIDHEKALVEVTIDSSFFEWLEQLFAETPVHKIYKLLKCNKLDTTCCEEGSNA